MATTYPPYSKMTAITNPVPGTTNFNVSQQNVSAGQYQVNPYSAWFGPINTIPELGPDKDIWRDHQQGPAAYAGKNVYVGDFVIGLVVARQEELTQIIPKRYSQEEHFTWTITRYDVNYVPEVPNEGVVKNQQYSFESGSAHTTRRGMGVKLEWDFYQTAMGKQTYINQISQMVNSMVRTYELEIMNALRVKPMEAGNWDRKYGYLSMSLINLLDSFVENFAVLAKQQDGYGLYTIQNWFQDVSQMNGVELTDVLGGMHIRRWVDLNFAKTKEYWARGPGGENQVANANKPKKRLGEWVYTEIKEFTDIKHKTTLGPMETFTMIGEYNTYFVEDRPKMGITPEDYINGMTTRIFDQEKGDYSDITAQMLFLNTHWENIYSSDVPEETAKQMLAWLFFYPECVDKNEQPKTGNELVAVYDRYFLRLDNIEDDDLRQVCEQFKLPDVRSSSKTAGKRIRDLYCVDPKQPEKCELFVKILKHLGFMSTSLFMRYLMNSMCGLRRGKETGELVIGEIDYGVQVDGNVKTMGGNATYKQAVCIYSPGNIFWFDNALYKQCLGGANSKFFTYDELCKLRRQSFKFNKFSLSDVIHSKSLIAFPVPRQATRAKMPKCIDVTGRFLDEQTYDEPEHHLGAMWMRVLLDMPTQRRHDEAPRKMLQKQLQNSNTIAYQGKQIYQTKLGEFDTYIINQGHHGPNVYPGCEKVRQNKNAEYKHIQAIEQIK